MADVDITIGADTSAAQAGLANLRNAAGSIMGELRGQFAQSLAIGGLVAAFDSLVSKLHDIHHEAARFGLDVEALQRVAIPAQEAGIGLETVARAMNMVALNGVKAAQGSKSQVEALNQLNINVLEFNNLKPDQQLIAVAEAYEKGAKTSNDYAAAATMLGKRFGTELIPAFHDIIEAAGGASDQLDIFNAKQVEAGEQAFKLLQKLKQVALVDIGGNLLVGISAVGAALIDAGEAAARLYSWLAKVSVLDFKGAAQQGQMFINVFKGQGPGGQFMQNIRNPPKSPATGSSAADIGSFIGGGGAGGGGGGGQQPFEILDDKAEKNRLAALTDSQRLNDLLRQQANLQADLEQGDATRNLSEQEGIDLETQLQDIDGQILPLRQKIADEAERNAEAAARWLESTTKAATEEAGNLQVMQLRALGENQLADILEIQLSYQTKINDAYNDGNTALADTLKLEEDIAVATRQKADQEQRAAAAANQIRDAAAALLYYNLRIGDTKSLPSFFTSPGGAGQLTGSALETMQRILSLSGQMSVAGMSPANTTLLANQIQNLIPLFQQQLQLLTSINKNLTPRPGGI